MAKGPTISTITAAFASASKLNANFAAIDTAFDNTVSLDGSTPNTMSGDLDMGSNDILNVGDITVSDLTIGGISVAAQAAAAAASASAAATSEANAATSFDNFDDIYLGAKASDPTLDNDGNALATGALYFNTASDLMRVYSGSAWADIAPVGGTVSSVGIADAGATEITVTNTPVTTSGTINLAIATIAGTKIDYSAGGNLDDAVVANASGISGKQAADATLTSLAAVAGVAGDILYASGTDVWTRLAKGSDGKALTLVSGIPAWSMFAPIVVFKTADETVNNSTTLQNDDHLLFALAANTTYWFDLNLLLDQTSTTPNYKFGWTAPSGCVMFWDSPSFSTSVVGDLLGVSSPHVHGTSGSGQLAETFKGFIRNGSTAGNLQLQWAQNTANASNTKILKHSQLIVREIGAT